jgi:hypothetical protein
MKKLHLLAPLAALLLAGTAWAAGKDEGGKEVKFTVYNGYFQSNKAGLKGPASYLVFTDEAAFNKVFGKAAVMGQKKTYLPMGAFESKMVVAVIKRGNALWTYKVDKVTADKGTLTVHYEAKSGRPSTARFASPLIISVDKDKYSSVVFVENGKKAETVKVGK